MKKLIFIVTLFCFSSFIYTQSITKEEIQRGKEIYEMNCASCHGESGKGDGPGGAGLDPKPRDFTNRYSYKQGSDYKSLIKTINMGVTGSACVPYAHLGKKSISDVAKYIITISTKNNKFKAKRINPEKEKVLAGFRKMVDYVKSDEYIAMVKEGKESNKSVFMSKMEKIAKSSGFTSFKHMDNTSKKFANDPDLKEVSDEFMQAVKDAKAKALEE